MAVAGYEVQIATTEGTFGDTVADVGNVLTHQFTGLTPDTAYKARVRAYDAAGNRSEWSANAIASTNAPAPLLIDLIGVSAYGAFGLRKLRAAYAGQCLRVRRTSDNAETDIGFDGNDLDWAAVAAFGATCHIDTWYDQSGNARHLTQDGGSQPILDQSNFEVDFDGSNDLMLSSTIDLSAVTALTVLTVHRVAAYTAGAGRILRLGSNTNFAALYELNDTSQGATQENGGGAYNYKAYSAAGETTYRQQSSVFSRAGSGAVDFWRNGTVETNGGAAGSLGAFPATSAIVIGGQADLTQLFNGSIKEVVIFASDIGTGPRQGAESDQMTYHSI